jgi:serine O-acetyltransferase
MEYEAATSKEWAGDSQFRRWQVDLARFQKHGYSGWGSEGFWALSIYRAQKALILNRNPLFKPAKVALSVLKKVTTLLTHIDLPKEAEIGAGLLIPHVGMVRLTPKSSIGADCALHHTVTLGADENGEGPVVGDSVMFGCHSCAIGPVKIGNGVKVGSGAVVVKDIPANTTAVGVPAKAR